MDPSSKPSDLQTEVHIKQQQAIFQCTHPQVVFLHRKYAPLKFKVVNLVNL